MSSSNNGVSPELIAVAAVIAVVLIILKFVFMVLFGLLLIVVAFDMGYLTFLSLLAWSKPRIIDGEIITPDEARDFIVYGICGSLLAFSGTALLDGLYALPLNEAFYYGMMFFGYAAGGYRSIYEHAYKKALAEAAAAHTAQEILPPPPPAIAPKPFTFASWDDEDIR